MCVYVCDICVNLYKDLIDRECRISRTEELPASRVRESNVRCNCLEFGRICTCHRIDVFFATPVDKVRMGLDRAGKTYSVLSDRFLLTTNQLPPAAPGPWLLWDQGKGS